MSDQILRDKTRTGKLNPWKERKIENVQYAEYLEILNYRKAHRVKECGEVLHFVADDEGRLKLAQTWFCKSRLCPLCNWRRARKQSAQLTVILTEANKQQPQGRFLFLTLTVCNTTGDQLQSELRQMGIAINRLFKYKKVAKNLLGYVRSTEITVQTSADQILYHHHMHVLLFVQAHYFSGKENYVSQDQWTMYWRKAMKLDYDPIVNIEAVHAKKEKGKGSLLASAQETAKYQVKSADILTDNQERDLQVVDDLEQGLERSRMISFGGLFKEIRKQLQLDDADNGNLIKVGDEDEKIDEVVREVVAKWDYERRNYFISG